MQSLELWLNREDRNKLENIKICYEGDDFDDPNISKTLKYYHPNLLKIRLALAL